jgi:hypothetical protein
MSGLDAVAPKPFVHGDCTADRGHNYSTVLDTEIVYRVRDYSHNQSMMATRAITELDVGEAQGSLENLDHVVRIN